MLLLFLQKLARSIDVYRFRGVNSYKLKEKIRLCEVWIRSGGVEEVSECVRNPTNSFVVGWPTSNYVAEFESVVHIFVCALRAFATS